MPEVQLDLLPISSTVCSPKETDLVEIKITVGDIGGTLSEFPKGVIIQRLIYLKGNYDN
jgi:hypothetical protein